MTNVAIIGGSGYGAAELVRLLHIHPYAKLTAIISHSKQGTDFSTVYPHMNQIADQTMEQLDVKKLSETIDLVFFATPSNVSKTIIPDFLASGITCIDLSGDFRLHSPAVYQQWYQAEAAAEEYLHQAVYGLSEINAASVRSAKLIANPGCYPTAALLGLIPVTEKELIEPNSIIIDGKTGVSGAGRSLSQHVHFAEMNENVKAYKLGSHKHIPEIEQALQEYIAADIQLTFTPHIVPMTRGIMVTCYAKLTENITTAQIETIYHTFYQQHPFVRVRADGEVPTTKEVYGSNYCDIAIHVDERTNRLTIISVIDNLVKGAAGQAIQNMNISNGWDQTTGLQHAPIYP
ncbi:N-acetyl-gamma-glutamyl-phosphate reductase [Paraliobacillus ryukyuensis]|uniref:N-acetyl-gamma-glutamyl-phosphate reductase n=1 Tax=Paraliobacillus ryukyuensis TaxID=200904 RepID=A0A366EDC5_9BACI|nr:N-acetyl-gamma-glutamyl-phosphate reductase [Paraliobacillus ryukyuensis]RBP00387.1 N-acetyl-gamma-glutamyl-phosphate reductase [Paraliobacillus ryukyuensis]